MNTSYHLCKECGDTNPENFYGHKKSLCKQCTVTQNKKRRHANPEKARLQDSQNHKNWRQTSPVKAKQKSRNASVRFKQANPEYHKNWRENHPRIRTTEQRKEEREKAKAINPGKFLQRGREYISRYRQRKHNKNPEVIDYVSIAIRDNNWCYICEQNILPEQPIDFDHVVPLSRNGIHTESNIKVTHAVCNRRKNNKLLSEMTDWQRRGP